MAGPPSPLKPCSFPATDVMTPVPTATCRMRLLFISATSTLPPPSIANPIGQNKLALVPGPPSPLKPRSPLPATVLMPPVRESTRRMRALSVSATSKFPLPSTATPRGAFKVALWAGPPSPLKLTAQPVPTTVVMIPVRM